MGGDRNAIGGFEIESELSPRTISGGSKRGPLKPGVEVDDRPEEFRSRTKEAGLTSKIRKGEIGVGKREGRGNMGTYWEVPRIVKGRRGRGGRWADGSSPGCKGSGLISLLKKFTPGKDDFDLSHPSDGLRNNFSSRR